MIGALLALSLAAADAPQAVALAPKLKAMNSSELLVEYDAVRDRKPGLGGPVAILAVSTTLAFVAFLVTRATFTTTDKTTGMKVTSSGDGPVPWTIFGIGVAAAFGSVFWGALNIRRRIEINGELEAIQDELDSRDQRFAQPAAQPMSEVEVAALMTWPLDQKKTGGLLIVAFDPQGLPVGAADVDIGGRRYSTNERGSLTIDELPPGPIALTLSRSDFRKTDEAAMVVAGTRSRVAVKMTPVVASRRAKLTGVVRSRATGGPVSAQLELVDSQAKAQTDAEGMFALDVPGGDYAVRISAPGHITQTKQVRVKEGERAIFNVDLYPE